VHVDRGPGLSVFGVGVVIWIVTLISDIAGYHLSQEHYAPAFRIENFEDGGSMDLQV
jgi:hypothetical protein